MESFLILLTALTANALANVFVKMAAVSLAKTEGIVSFLLGSMKNLYIWLALVCFAVAFVLYGVSLTKLKLSVAYPIMTSAGFILVSLFSHFLFKESVTVTKIIGMVVIVTGIWLVSI
jgi:multidrug transporter EmrE-like cation transporter